MPPYFGGPVECISTQTVIQNEYQVILKYCFRESPSKTMHASVASLEATLL